MKDPPAHTQTAFLFPADEDEIYPFLKAEEQKINTS
jgi:hypothetical protein